MDNKCIYCLRSENLTKSHIFPEGLGGKQGPDKTVCDKCNGEFGRTVEAKVCRDFSFYRYIAQIKSKGKQATTPASLSVMGHNLVIKKMLPGGIPSYIPPIIIDKGPPRSFIQVAESPVKLKKYMAGFIKKMGINYDETLMSVEDVKLIFYNELSSIDSIDFRRLVTKIAFERFCRIRPQQKYDKDLDPIREFIIKGTSTRNSIAVLFYERDIVNNILQLPFPYHSVLIFGRNQLIASIVTLFGLFYYLVILNPRAVTLTDWINYLYLIPTKRQETEPIFRTSYPLSALINRLHRAPKGSYALQSSKDYARARFENYLREIGMIRA
jgi:hypothetical protein